LAGKPPDESQLTGEAATLIQRIQDAVRERPLAIAVDDIDLADSPSLSVLGQVLAALTAPAALRGPGDGIAGGLILLSARDTALPGPLTRGLQGLPVTTLALRPFDSEAVRRYLSQSGVADRLLEATGGVPSHLEAILAAPPTIDLALRRIERLSPTDRELLTTLALLSRPESADFIGEVSDVAGVSQKLIALAGQGWVSVVPDIGRTRFSLARTSDRAAILERTSPERRRSLLTCVADAYANSGEAECAFAALLLAGNTARAESLGWTLACEMVERSALEPAQEILEKLAGIAVDRDSRRVILLKLAEVLTRRGEVRQAAGVLGRARALASTAEQEIVRGKIARLCAVLGAARQAERLASRALASGARSADAVIALAEARFLRGHYDEAIALAQDLPEGVLADRVALENVRGKALLTLGRLVEARETFQSNAARAQGAGLRVEQARALLNVGVVAHRQGARDEARSAYRAALLAGETPFTAIVHANLSSLHLEDGEIESALSESHRALAVLTSAGRLKEQSHAAQNLARIYLFMGDVARARDIAVHAEALAARVGDPYLGAGARFVRTEAELAQRAPGAIDALLSVVAEFRQLGNPRYQCESLLLLAEARLVAGDGGARAALDDCQTAGALGIPALLPEWYLLQAELALHEGHGDLAGAALATAREGLAIAPHVELPARLLGLSARLAEVRGDSHLAQAERLKAIRILEQIATHIPPDRRSLFFARPRWRALFDQAGRELAELPVPAPPPSVAVESPPVLIGRAASIGRINQLVERIGPSSATVLIRGESGTGKELVARALHDRSARRDLPLVAVNCGALSEELLLSELFGHERGAFTGAVRDRKGRFELAAGGTIFLDEIGDISPRAQVALLRVLQERTFERIGGSRTITVDVRLVCATNRPLEELMRRGQFREDLYYRLRGTTLMLPALREHPEDIEELCNYFLTRQARQQNGHTPWRLSREALSLLKTHPWPGNVRELFNLVESASLLATGSTIGPEAFELFPEILRVPSRTLAQTDAATDPDFYRVLRDRDLSLRDLRRELDLACISQALRDASGNISEAARLLKMKRSRLSQIINVEPSLRALRDNDGDGPQLADDGADVLTLPGQGAEDD
jgi:DNA-binding NtrC family response regulator